MTSNYEKLFGKKPESKPENMTVKEAPAPYAVESGKPIPAPAPTAAPKEEKAKAPKGWTVSSTQAGSLVALAKAKNLLAQWGEKGTVKAFKYADTEEGDGIGQTSLPLSDKQRYAGVEFSMRNGVWPVNQTLVITRAEVKATEKGWEAKAEGIVLKLVFPVVFREVGADGKAFPFDKDGNRLAGNDYLHADRNWTVKEFRCDDRSKVHLQRQRVVLVNQKFEDGVLLEGFTGFSSGSTLSIEEEMATLKPSLDILKEWAPAPEPTQEEASQQAEAPTPKKVKKAKK